MFIRIQSRQITKKINLKGVNTYSQFVGKVKANLNNLSEEFTFYYYDESKQRFQVDNDESFQGYLAEEPKPKIIVKPSDQDFLNQSMIQKVGSSSNSNSSVLSSLIEEALPASEQKNEAKPEPEANFKREGKAQESSLDESKGSIKTKSTPKVNQPTSSKYKMKDEAISELIEKKLQTPIKKEAKVIKEQPKIVKEQPKVVKVVHKNIKCKDCEKEVVGIRWKCLDLFDVDVCDQCYKEKKQKHTFLKIQTEDYLSKLNYRDSIYRLFNPNYEGQATSISQPVKPWIKEQDILQSTPEAVKEIWTASEAIARKVANEFDAWQKEWQKKAIKS